MAVRSSDEISHNDGYCSRSRVSRRGVLLPARTGDAPRGAGGARAGTRAGLLAVSSLGATARAAMAGSSPLLGNGGNSSARGSLTLPLKGEGYASGLGPNLVVERDLAYLGLWGADLLDRLA